MGISEMAERAAARCAIFLLLALVCTATGSGLADESVVVLDSSETDARGGSTKPESAADKSAKKELSEAKPGSSKQVLKMILKEAKKLPMTAAQRKEWEATGMDKAAKNIAAGEVEVQDVDKLVKMVKQKQRNARLRVRKSLMLQRRRHPQTKCTCKQLKTRSTRTRRRSRSLQTSTMLSLPPRLS